MEPFIHRESEVRRNNRHLCQDLGDECVILDLDAGVYYGLDEVGQHIWKLIAAPRTVRAIREELVAEYDIDSPRCERDLLTLLGDMRRAGLIEIIGASS